MAKSKSKIRKEKDSLGNVELPEIALYGVATKRAIEATSFSGKRLRDYPAMVKSLAAVKKAAALANMSAGVIGSDVCRAICNGCDELISGAHLKQFPVDALSGGGSVAFNMNINEVIANLANQSLGFGVGAYAPVHPKVHVNASQSTADSCHTAYRLTIICAYELLQADLINLIKHLEIKRDSFKKIVTASRTCMQDALPVSVSSYFSSYASQVSRIQNNLDRSSRRLHKVNLGGTVLGTGHGATKEYRGVVIEKLNHVTEREFYCSDDLYDSAQNVDELVSLANELANLAFALIKMMKDLRLLSSGPDAGFGELNLPAVMEGSSFFKDKTTPVIPETVINGCFQVLGHARAVTAVAEHGELNLNIFESVAVFNLLDQMDLLAASTGLFTRQCLKGITVNEARCKEFAGYVS